MSCTNDKSFRSKDDVVECERLSQLMCPAFKSPTKIIRLESLNSDVSSVMIESLAVEEDFGER